MSKRTGPGICIAMLTGLPGVAGAQTISSGLPTVAPVPANNAVALAVLLGAVALAGWAVLRRSSSVTRSLPMLALAAVLGMAVQGTGLIAQVVNAFTNPTGETLPIPISPITGNGFTGFEPADFTNNSGTTLRIAAIETPTLAQCFASQAAETLLPSTGGGSSPHPQCAVGTLLLSGATCRVDVDAWCRGLYVSGATLASISPNAGSASGGVGVTLTGTGFTGATAVTFDGVAATSVNVINSTTLTAVTPAHAPGAVHVAVFTPAGAAQLTNGFTYLATAVGQFSGGGVIAGLDGGLNNLIAALADNSSGVEWGGQGTAVGAGAQSLSDGASNTAAVVAALGSGGYAASLCNDFEVDSQGNTPCQAGNTCYSDWFLPARNQLGTLFANRVAVGGFSGSDYWSSTEWSVSPNTVAIALEFSGGNEFWVSKGNAQRARCVRSFTP